ncbi:MAG: hypothetical protein ABIT58_00160, partial [Ferruginibacter sp.]
MGKIKINIAKFELKPGDLDFVTARFIAILLNLTRNCKPTKRSQNAMKNILFLAFTFCQVVVYGQIENLIKPQLTPHTGPDYTKTIYPKGDTLTYNQYVGETIAGYVLASGWRKDTINGGCNKEIYGNPFVTSQAEYVGFEKQKYEGNFTFYRYQNGKKYTGKISDTLELNYTAPVASGKWNGNPYYESKRIKFIFQADCMNGSILGAGTLSVADSNRLISSCYFENSEITGETVTRGIYSDNIYKRNYKNGDFKLASQSETDKERNEIVAIDNNKKFSFKE